MHLGKCEYVSVFQAELLAILKTTQWGNTIGRRYSICSYCMSAIEDLSQPFKIDITIDTVEQTAKHSNNNIKISLVKGYVGIKNSEDTDKLAKNVALNQYQELPYFIENQSHLLKIWLKN